jgi:hypothetical protein
MKKAKPRLFQLNTIKKGTLLLHWVPFFLLFGAWALNCQNPFFWDTVQLASRQAGWYFDQNFKYLLLPDAIDSGHPSGFGMYLALCWKLFGQTLLVSHLAMLPFIGLFYVGLLRIGSTLDAFWGRFLPLLVAVDPVILGQVSLVSPDTALIALFLWGFIVVKFRFELRYAQLILTFCCLGLAMISLRGMMAVVVLYLFQAFTNKDFPWKNLLQWLQTTLPYLPSGLFALAFLMYHAQAKSWIGFHGDSPWQESFKYVTFNGLIKNCLILLWRLLDYGRIFMVLGILFLLVQKRSFVQTNKPYLLLFILALLIQTPHFLLFKGLNAHRYLLPTFLAGHLLFLSLLAQGKLSGAFKSGLLIVVTLGLLSGNCWIYPRGIAQGWDSTPAHWAHFGLRSELIQYLDQHKIPLAEVGTVFPEVGPLHWRDLHHRQEGFSPVNLNANQYIYYSSTMNDFTNGQRAILWQQWTKVLIRKRAGLETILFKKPAQQNHEF